MPINTKNDDLSNIEKEEVKIFFKNLMGMYQGTFHKEDLELLTENIELISESKKNTLREFSFYLNAIILLLKLKQCRHFFTMGEKRLLASLRYFIALDDVIPDYDNRGYIDDIYCLNYALSLQSKIVKEKIEISVSALRKKDEARVI